MKKSGSKVSQERSEYTINSKYKNRIPKQISNPRIQQVIDILKAADSLFVLTGAGISAESGIPTFRGKDGLWKNYSATDLATPDAFSRDPALVWEWYHWRQDIIRKAQPNPGHLALVDLEKKVTRFLLLTQNVDNLHHVAGSKNLMELHGNIFRARCLACNKILDHSTQGHVSTANKKDTPNLPTCPSCRGLLRPDVVWFGEPIPQDIWLESIEFLSKTDAAIIIGTSNVVWPAAQIPAIAKHHGIKTIEINLEPTPVSDLVDAALFGKAGEILPAIVCQL